MEEQQPMDESKLEKQEEQQNNSMEKLTGFEIISEGFSAGIFSKGEHIVDYARKLLKLFTIGFILISLSLFIFYVVLDIGINTSYYSGGHESGLKDLLDENVAEKFTDLNGNKIWDIGEKFEDNNNDGIWNDAESIGKFLFYFIDRKNSIIIYIGMLFLLFSFNITVFKRLKFLWASYVTQYDINETIIYAPDREKKAGYELIVQEEDDSPNICKRFIVRFFRSFKTENNKDFFSHHYDNYKTEEEEGHFLFENSINTSSVWIIRLGIFGTLLGITLAFFELYAAIDTVSTGGSGSGGITAGFKSQLQHALLGNALAVITSLAAHGSTLFLEIGVSYFLRNENNIDWMERSYNAVMEYPGFSTSVIKAEESVGELNGNLAVLNDTLEHFSQKVQEVIPTVNIMNQNFLEINSTFNTLKENVNEMTLKQRDYENALSSAADGLNSIANESINSKELLSKLRVDVEEKIKPLEAEFESITGTASSLTDNMVRLDRHTEDFAGNMSTMNNVLSSIKEAFQSLGSKLKD